MPKPPFGGKGKKPLPFYPIPLMEEWLQTLEGLSEAHQERSKLVMKHFGLFCRQEGLRHPEELERRHILRFQAYLQDYRQAHNNQLTSPHHQASIMRGLRAWLMWLEKNDYITQQPWERIRLVPKQLKASKPISEDDIAHIFATHRQSTFTSPPFFYHRREAILALLYGWGLALGELTNLNVPTVDLRQDFVVIRYSNGNRSRQLPYSPELKGVVNRWLTVRATRAIATDPALLIDMQGQRITHASVRKILLDLGQRAGVNLHPSRMRDTFGLNLMQKGVDVHVVADLLGHVNAQRVPSYDPNFEAARMALKEHVTPELTRLLGSNMEYEYKEQA